MPQVPCPGCQRSITLEFDDLTKVIECGGCDTRFGPLVRTGGSQPAPAVLDVLEVAEPTPPPRAEVPAPRPTLSAGTSGLREVDLLEGQSRDFVPAELQPLPQEPRRKRPKASPPPSEAPEPNHVPLLLSLGVGLLAVVIVMGTLLILFQTGAFEQRYATPGDSGGSTTPTRQASVEPRRSFPAQAESSPAPAVPPEHGADYPRQPAPPAPAPPRFRPGYPRAQAGGPVVDGGVLRPDPLPTTSPQQGPGSPPIGARRPPEPFDDDPFEGRRAQLPDLRPRGPGVGTPGGNPADIGGSLPGGAAPGAVQGRTNPAPALTPNGTPAGWVAWSIVGSNFSAWMPARPSAEARVVATAGGQATQTTFTAANDAVTVTVAVATFPAEKKNLVADKLYRSAQKSAAKQLKATVDSEDEATCGEHKGRSAVLTADGKKVYVRWFLVDHSLYTLGITGRKGDPDAEAIDFFFDNVTLGDD